MSLKRLIFCQQLHGLFRLIQRQNRFVATSPVSDLSLLESHALMEIDSRPDLSVSALARLLGWNQGNLSRLAGALLKRGLICSGPAGTAGRRLAITPKSRTLLQAIDRHADRQIEGSLKGLSPGQRPHIAALYHACAEGLRTPPALSRPREHPLRTLQRRVTRGLGLLGGSAFDSGLNSSSYQLLALLFETETALSQKAICEMLGMKPANLSGLLSSFEKQGVVQRRRETLDQRHLLITLTSRGRTQFAGLERRAVRQLQSALQGVSDTELARYVETLSAYVRAGALAAGPAGLRLQRLAGERPGVRAFIVRNLVRLGLEGRMPATLCGSASVAYVALQGKEMVAACHFENSGHQSIFNCFTWAPALDRSALRRAILDCAVVDQRRYTANVEVSPAAGFLTPSGRKRTRKSSESALLLLPIT